MSDTSDNTSKNPNFEGLKFIRVFTPVHVPKELIEQIREKEYTVDDWYKHQEEICTIVTKDGPRLNPLSMLYVVADEGNKVVGTLWTELNTLENALIIQTFSMDREYWHRGKAVQLLADKAKEIAKSVNVKKIYYITNYPKHSEWYGYKRSKGVLMEYDMDEEEKSDG